MDLRQRTILNGLVRDGFFRSWTLENADMHKAAPDPSLTHCKFCGQRIRLVLGNDGIIRVWIHAHA